jgi:hypothetical protein
LDLDKKDRLIIEALQQDARQSLSALGKRIGLSQPAVSERVKKLEDREVICGYSASGFLWVPVLPTGGCCLKKLKCFRCDAVPCFSSAK